MSINVSPVKQLPTRSRSLVSIARKIVGWLRRYLPAEAMGITAALLGIKIALFSNQGTITVALVGAWSEVAGFYLAMVVQEYIIQRTRRLQLAADTYQIALTDATRSAITSAWHLFVREQTALIGRSLRTLLFEFGVAEFLDALLVRPAFLTIAMQVVPDLPLAVVIGKVAADCVFYTVAISSFEMRKQFNPID